MTNVNPTKSDRYFTLRVLRCSVWGACADCYAAGQGFGVPPLVKVCKIDKVATIPAKYIKALR